MTDHISREAAVEKLNKLCDRVCQYSKAQRKYMCGACPLGDAFTVIEDDIPAADVRPAARGRWINQRADSEMCSACGVRFYISALFAVGGNDEPNFCPNCGADMREESNEKA